MADKSPNSPYFAFANFALYPEKRILLGSQGEQLELTGRAFDILVFLIEHQGQIMSKKEIMDAVWPDAVVEENNLNQAIHAVRKVLLDSSSNQKMIINVPRRGYSFVADVKRIESGQEDSQGAEEPTPESYPTSTIAGRLVAVSAAYAIAIWLCIQIVNALAAGAATWLVRSIALLIILGAPLVLVASKAIVLNPSRSLKTSSHRFRIDLAPIFFLLIGIGFLSFQQFASFDVLPEFVATQQEPLPVRRSSLNLGPTDFSPTRGISTNFAISPDGKRIAYFKFEANAWQLYLRELDSLEPRALNVRTPQAVELPMPVFSPDGESIAYYTRTGLMRISIREGEATPQLISYDSNALGIFGIAWVGDDIYFIDEAFVLRKAPEAGGSSAPVSPTGDASLLGLGSVYPSALPGGEALLLTKSSFIARQVVLLDLRTNLMTPLILEATNARYVHSGHILFVRDGSLWAVPFDLPQLQIAGEEVLINASIERDGAFGFSSYGVSNDGLLVYQPVSTIAPQQRIEARNNSTPVWVDRSGNEALLNLPEGYYVNPHLSNGDRRLALRVVNSASGGSTDIWGYDFDLDTFQRLTFVGSAITGKWTPDGQQLVYVDGMRGFDFWLTAADGSGEPRRLGGTNGTGNLMGFTPDGQNLIYHENTPSLDLKIRSLGDDTTSSPLIESEFNTGTASISPNGRWIAYYSAESGRAEIYVRPYPDIAAGKWQISTEGGFEPEWREDSGELYFRWFEADSTMTIWAAPIESGDDFIPGQARKIINGNYLRSSQGPSYDVNEAGDRFLLLKPAPTISADKESESVTLILVNNWFEELKQLAPTGIHENL